MLSERWELPHLSNCFITRRSYGEGRASIKACQADKETKRKTTIQICFVEGGSRLSLRAGSGGSPL